MSWLSRQFDYFVSYLGSNSDPVATNVGLADPSRRAFLEQAAGGVAYAATPAVVRADTTARVFQTQATDHGFRPGDFAAHVYEMPVDMWGAALDALDPQNRESAVASLRSMVLGDYNAAQSVLRTLEQNMNRAEHQYERATERQAAPVGRAEKSVERWATSIKRRLDGQARSAGGARHRTSLAEAKAQKELKAGTAEIIETDAATMGAARDALVERFSGRMWDDKPFRGVFKRFNDSIEPGDDLGRYDRKVEALKKAHGAKNISDISLSGRANESLRRAMSHYDDTGKLQTRLSREQYEEAVRVQLIDHTPKGRAAVYEEFKDEIRQSAGRSPEQVALDVAKHPDNLDERYDTIRGLEGQLSDTGKGRLERVRAGSPQADAGAEVDPSLKVPAGTIKIINREADRLERREGIAREDTLAELDRTLQEKGYSADDSMIIMKQVEQDYVRRPEAGLGNDQSGSQVDAVSPADLRRRSVESDLGRVTLPAYQKAIRGAVGSDGHVTADFKAAAGDKIREEYRARDSALQGLSRSGPGVRRLPPSAEREIEGFDQRNQERHRQWEELRRVGPGAIEEYLKKKGLIPDGRRQGGQAPQSPQLPEGRGRQGLPNGGQPSWKDPSGAIKI